MNYTALYRKFRPLTFGEMVGQEHITRTLKNQLIADRVGHAYLFNGGRGTGKTSSAKILARAINCLNPQKGEPCNECEICREALNGSLTDIVEMDAASNSRVEDIRQIVEEVNFLPTKAKYRVYIIDEVHMLSTAAFNALLKTLEEPPEHVKFILATTEPQKLPATILSRCQRFDFKQISNEDMIKRLQIVCDEIGIEITKEALSVIAILAEGGMRDALSILERCVQDGETKIDENKVKELVGIPKLTYINKIVRSIVDKDVNTALETIDIVIEDGKDIQNFLWEIIKYVKDILVYKSSGKADLYSEDEKGEIRTISSNIGKEELLSIIYKLSELESQMKYSSQKTTLLQVTIIELCTQKQFANSQDLEVTNAADFKELEMLNKKIDELEKNIREIQKTVVKEETKTQFETEKTEAKIVDNNINMSTKEEIKKEVVKNVETKEENKIVKEEKEKIELQTGEKLQQWPKILQELKESGKIILYNNLVNTVAIKVNDMVIGIEFRDGLTAFGKTMLERSENIAELERRISIECGKPMTVRYITKKEDVEKVKENPIESFALGMDIPFNVVDE